MTYSELDQQAVNTIRILSADAVQQANSGHPGLPMGSAAMAYVLWTRFLRHNPSDPTWHNRDRFILSGGHGSMLLYSLLHLTGYALSLDDLKAFRQWGSKTPGHPEYGHTPGVETTTGPLGQGFATGVGMAMAEAYLAATFNKADAPTVVDHFTYAIVTDGDLMEGVASEAASLAGHLGLGKLIYLYDDNQISIDGSTDLAFTEDRAKRFEAYGWHVQRVADGNDMPAIEAALRAAQAETQRPSLILVRTVIGYGAAGVQGTEEAHGKPLGEEELAAVKKYFNWPTTDKFFVPEEVAAAMRQAVKRGKEMQAACEVDFAVYGEQYPTEAATLRRMLSGDLPAGWADKLPQFSDPKGDATRNISGKVIQVLAAEMPELIGGSADLAPSNMTEIKGSPNFSKGHPEGRNLRFGVREHAMGAILNGMALHGGVVAYGGTFLVFADYMRPAIRMAALMRVDPIYIFTHDSIGLGEDGPTHQPIEHLASLRAIPHMTVVRPADANETVGAWQLALNRRKQGPVALALTRQRVRTFSSDGAGVLRGAYVLRDSDGTPAVILMATGSEVELAIDAAEALAAKGVSARVVSMPSFEVFAEQPESYRNAVLPPEVRARVAIEAGIEMGWSRWLGAQGVFVGLSDFGASAPYQVLYREFGLTVDAVVVAAQTTIANSK